MKSKKKVNFTKMHGAGNDYIYINAMDTVPENLPLLSCKISDRHFGVGSDGLVAIMPSGVADFRMRMFNADGSEGEMCGNASRCIGKYVYERGLTSKTEVSLETLAGIKILKLEISEGEVTAVTVDMGEPVLSPENVVIYGFSVTAVSMGNPHAVIFCDEITDKLVLGMGPQLEVASVFPNKSNIEFVRVINRDDIEMRVWERGSGETLACGTGACAAVVAAVLNGFTGRHVRVSLPGGVLEIIWDEKTNHVFLKGEAEFVADGCFYIPDEPGRVDL